MKGKILAVCRFSIVLLLLTILMLYSLLETGLDGSMHKKLYKELGSDKAAGLTDEGLNIAAQRIALTLSTGNTRLMEYEDEVNGVNQRVFNEREISHMKDVVGLFALLRKTIYNLMLAIYALGALCLILDVLRWKKGLIFNGSGQRIARHWGNAIVGGTLCWFVLLIAAVAVCALNFDRAFILFHQFFFTNDLWLMNPETDLIIRLMPTEFFIKLAARVALLTAIRSFLVMAVGLAIFVILRWKVKRNV